MLPQLLQDNHLNQILAEKSSSGKGGRYSQVYLSWLGAVVNVVSARAAGHGTASLVLLRYAAMSANLTFSGLYC